MQLPIRSIVPALMMVAALAAAGPATAQTTDASVAPTGLWLTTPHPEFSVAAGDTISIPLTLRNDNLPPQRAEFDVSGLPDGWSWTLKGGGHDVTAAMVLPDESRSMELTLTPPDNAALKAYAFQVRARYGSGQATLPMSLTLTEKKAAEVSLEPELPGLVGTPNSTFQFKVKVTNDSPDDQLFNLAADAPAGFSITFKKGFGTEEITGVPIAAGASETVTIAVKPNASVAAGDYPMRFAVLAGDLSASTELGMRITGQPELRLNGPQDRFSGEAVAGEAKSFAFTLDNTGSADAEQVKLSSTSPQGWTIAFDPGELAVLPAGASQAVSVTITPTEKAIAGDYITTIRVNGTGVSTSEQFRVTVGTSTMWGVVGLIVIAAAVLVLVLAVLRYGRR